MRGFLAAALAGAALLAAGCGGSSSSAAKATGGPAELAPKDVGAWISVDTDRTSDQWKALDAVLAQIPGAEKLVNDALAQIGGGDKKLDFRNDVQPALGKEVVIVVPAGSSDPVLLAKPTDAAKFKALLGSASKPPVTVEFQGWTAVAQTQTLLDAYRAALDKGTLADSGAFTKAMDGLPAEAIARVFVNGKGLAGALGKAAKTASGALKSIPVPGLGTALGTSGTSVSPKALEQLGTIGLALSAGDHVVRIDGSIETGNSVNPVSYAPTLLGKVPSDALVAVSFHGGSAITGQFKDAAGADALKQVEKQLGVSFDDLGAVLDGEGALYVRAGAPIPEITLAVRPSDPAHAKATLDEIVAAFGKQAAASTSIPGLTIALTTATAGDVVLVSTSERIGSSFGGGPKLTATDRFKQAAADVSFGDTTAGFAYVDVHGLGPLLQTALGSLGASNGTTGGLGLGSLSAIDTLAVNATADGARIHIEGVVRVR